MSGRRQKIQYELAFKVEGRGEAPRTAKGGTELRKTERNTENPVSTEQLMEEICERANMEKALRRVKANKGAGGIDEMTVERLPAHLRKHWPTIREELFSGSYKPQPVKRVEIPKGGGGVRKLGIPTVLDRFIQQAVLQVLSKHWDGTFSEYSYGFRPGRSTHQAVSKAQGYMAQGHRYVVDIDLEKFFDRVNHDKLMGRIAKGVRDKRVLKLIRAFLNAGVMENGLVSPISEGTPQGGPLSPLLSNIVLDDLDKELEKRGHKFVRYADDCNIYVRSERAGHRVMESISKYITEKLKLKVNEEKSAVARSYERQFLGFSFTNEEQPRRRIGPKAIKRFKKRIRELTRRTRGVNKDQIAKLSEYMVGWQNYFGFCETPSVMDSLNSWIRRRLRAAIWKQWRQGRTRFKRLRRRGLSKDRSAKLAGSAHGPWRISRLLSIAFPNAYFQTLGVPTLAIRAAT